MQERDVAPVFSDSMDKLAYEDLDRGWSVGSEEVIERFLKDNKDEIAERLKKLGD